MISHKHFSLTMQLTKNPNARQNKLTNNHVSLRPREHVETVFLRNQEKVFLHAITQKQRMESFKWTCQVYYGNVKTMSRKSFHSKALFTVVIVKSF